MIEMLHRRSIKSASLSQEYSYIKFNFYVGTIICGDNIE